MIVMHCDRCGEEIPTNESGGCRVKLGRDEYIFHLCEEGQDDVLAMIQKAMLTPDRVVEAKGHKLR